MSRPIAHGTPGNSFPTPAPFTVMKMQPSGAIRAGSFVHLSKWTFWPSQCSGPVTYGTPEPLRLTFVAGSDWPQNNSPNSPSVVRSHPIGNCPAPSGLGICGGGGPGAAVRGSLPWAIVFRPVGALEDGDFFMLGIFTPSAPVEVPESARQRLFQIRAFRAFRG